MNNRIKVKRDSDILVHSGKEEAEEGYQLILGYLQAGSSETATIIKDVIEGAYWAGVVHGHMFHQDPNFGDEDYEVAGR